MNQKQKLIVHLEEKKTAENRRQEIYEELMNWKIEKQELLKSEFIDQAEWLPVITFILGTITTGFLKAIGSEIWANVKEIFSEAEVGPPGFKFVFSYQGVKIEAEVESSNLQDIRQALDNLEELIIQVDVDRQKEVKFIWTGENNWQQE